MNLFEIFEEMGKCHGRVCDECPLNSAENNCMYYISKLLRQEVDKILAANDMLKEEIEELKQENIELDEKLHGQPSFTPFEFKIPSSEDAVRWLKSMP
jgi:hypothetical protein